MPPVKMTRAEYEAKYGVAPVVRPATTSAPVAKMTRKEYEAKYGKAPVAMTTAPAETAPQEEGGILKALVGAPATMIARPFQAAQSLGQVLGSNTDELTRLSQQNTDSLMKLVDLRRQKAARGEDTSHINKTIADIRATPDYAAQELGAQGSFKPTSGGVVAAAPENFSDVKKDVGRALQTVAYGAGPGSLMAGGAMFGVGMSLEEGNDLFSESTLLQGVLGAAGGKLIDVVGKPIFNAAGKVIGTVTPAALKTALAAGGGAVEALLKSAMKKELFGGVASPLAKTVTKGMEGFDTAINKGAKELFSTPSKLYPGLKKEAMQTRWAEAETDRFIAPTREEGTTYYNSKKVLSDAADSGVTEAEVKQTLKDSKIFAINHNDGKKFTTDGVADELTDATMKNGPDILRPALREAQGGVPNVTMDDFRTAVANAVKNSKGTPQEKYEMLQAMAKEYGTNSPTSKYYQDGFSLEDLYNHKLNADSYVYAPSVKTGTVTFSDSAVAARKKIEGNVFKSLLVDRTPAELGIEQYLKEQQKRFITANYLRSLNGKPIPKSMAQRVARVGARAAGGVFGAQLGGPWAIYPGLQLGVIGSDVFQKAKNPIKVSFLKQLQKTEAEAYKIMKDFVSKKEFDRMWMKTPLLGPGDPSAVNMGLQKAQGTTFMKNSKGQWVEVKTGAIPLNYPTRPVTEQDKILNNLNQEVIRLRNTPQLPAPAEAIQLPAAGTPNQPGRPYIPGGEIPRVGGVAQAAAEPHAVAVARWKFDTKKGLTTDTFETWMQGRTPEGLPPVATVTGGKTVPGETGTIAGNKTEPARVFSGKGPGYKKFNDSMDRLVANKTLLPEDADILKVLFADADDKALAAVATRDSGLMKQSRGIFSRAVRMSTGETISGTPQITLKKGIAGLPLDRADKAPIKVFLHEYGHYAHRLVLTKEEQAIASKVYRDMGKERTRSMFRGGLSNPAEGSMTGAQYYAKNENEFMAQSFAEYILENKIPAKQMKPLLDRLVEQFMKGLKRLVNRGPVPGMEKMTPIFEKMLSGDRANPLANYMATQPQSFRNEIQALLSG